MDFIGMHDPQNGKTIKLTKIAFSVVKYPNI